MLIANLQKLIGKNKAATFEPEMENQSVVKVSNLRVSFTGKKFFEAIKNLSFSIECGRTTVLVGQSGSGKSVTSLALMGLLPEQTRVSGRIQLGGFPNLLELDAQQWEHIRGKEIAMIFQEPMSALNPVQTCGNQLIESIRTHQKLSRSAARKMAINWFDKVKLPDPESLMKRYPHQLSGGQKQRVMIAMAMCNHPKLLIADEPTTALDVTVQQEIILLMQELQREFGIALLFITHDIRLAQKIADRILVMEQGNLVENTIRIKEWIPEKKWLGDDKEILLSVAHLKVYYTHPGSWLDKNKPLTKAVDDVSFDLYRRETLGLVGESGCGKSTLSQTVLGLRKITSGALYFKEKLMNDFSAQQWRENRKHIQMVFQDPYASLNPRMSIGAAIAEPIKIHGMAKGAMVEKRVFELLDQVQLSRDSFYKYPHEFSGGQRQRICIARALAVDPELMICDESVAALDVNTQEQILKLLKSLQMEKNLTYLFITHDLNLVKAISDRVLVMHQGKIVESGSVHEVMNHPRQLYTRQLIAAAL